MSTFKYLRNCRYSVFSQVLLLIYQYPNNKKSHFTSIELTSYPIGSMYAIYGNIYHQYTPNVSIYTIHGSYGYMTSTFCNIPTFLIPIPQETRFQGTQPAGRRRHGHGHGHDHHVAGRRRRSHNRGDSGQVGRPKRWRKVTCDIERTSSIVGVYI